MLILERNVRRRQYSIDISGLKNLILKKEGPCSIRSIIDPHLFDESPIIVNFPLLAQLPRPLLSPD